MVIPAWQNWEYSVQMKLQVLRIWIKEQRTSLFLWNTVLTNVCTGRLRSWRRKGVHIGKAVTVFPLNILRRSKTPHSLLQWNQLFISRGTVSVKRKPAFKNVSHEAISPINLMKRFQEGDRRLRWFVYLSCASCAKRSLACLFDYISAVKLVNNPCTETPHLLMSTY